MTGVVESCLTLSFFKCKSVESSILAPGCVVDYTHMFFCMYVCMMWNWICLVWVGGIYCEEEGLWCYGSSLPCPCGHV